MNISKILIIISLLLFGIDSFSQSLLIEPQNVMVKWKVGTTKTITQSDSTIIYANDSIFMATGMSTNYSIKIMSKKDTIYEVLFKQIRLDNISVESEMINTSPIELMMQELIMEMQKKISGLEYSFFVNQKTALAFKIKNEDELRRLVDEMVVVVLNQFFDKSKIELDETKKNEIKLMVRQYLEEQLPAAMQTMLNAFNYIFQAYSFPFILNETYTQEIEVYSIDQINHADDNGKAKLLVNSSSTKTELLIDYKYIYDINEAYRTYVVAQGKADQIPITEFEIDERVETKFDIESSWIKTSSSFVDAKMGAIVVKNTSQVVIK